MRRGVILCGPPASGKDTITRELSQLSTDYTLFRKLKAGSGGGATYRAATVEQIQNLTEAGDILQSSRRYGNVYAVDRRELESLFRRDAVPIIHMGDLAGVRTLQTYPAAWLSVLLCCSRQLTEDRLHERASNDVAGRMAAWDEAAIDLAQSRPGDFDLYIDTAQRSIGNAAQAIHDQLISLPITRLIA